jgi:hypothetical protein
MAEVSVGTVGTQTNNDNFGIINLQKTKKKPYDIAFSNNRKEPKIKPDIKYTAKQRFRQFKTKVQPNVYKRVMVDEEDDMVNKIREAFGLNAIKKNKNYQEVETAPNPYYNEPQPKIIYEDQNKKDDVSDILIDDFEALTLQEVPRRGIARQSEEEIEETPEQKKYYAVKNALENLTLNFTAYREEDITKYLGQNKDLIKSSPELTGLVSTLGRTIDEYRKREAAERGMREREERMRTDPAAANTDPFRFATPELLDEIDRNSAQVRRIREQVKFYEQNPNAYMGDYQSSAASREIDDALSDISTAVKRGIPTSLIAEYWEEADKKKGMPGRRKKDETIQKEIADLFRKQKKINEKANIKYEPIKFRSTGYYEYFSKPKEDK